METKEQTTAALTLTPADNKALQIGVEAIHQGAHFREMRKLAGKTLARVARHLSLSESQISRFETGKYELSPKKMARLEKFLNPSLSDKAIKKNAEKRAQLAAAATVQSANAFIRLITGWTPEQLEAERKAEQKRLVDRYGSVENYERIEAEMQKVRQENLELRMKLSGLQAQLERQEQFIREQAKPKRQGSAFYGE